MSKFVLKVPLQLTDQKVVNHRGEDMMPQGIAHHLTVFQYLIVDGSEVLVLLLLSPEATGKVGVGSAA